MNLRSYLESKGALGTRTIRAIDWFLQDKMYVGEFEDWVKDMTQACLKTRYCRIHNLGRKGLLLLAEYYHLEIPEKVDTIPGLKASLTMARKYIAQLQQEIKDLRASSNAPSSPAASPASDPQP
jgi:hypothetical protein